MTKKLTFISFLMILLLAACAGASGAATSPTGLSDGSVQATGNTGADQALTQPVLLAVGTLRLEETDLAVQADQAAQLLPLWQAYRSLSASETTAAVELEAVISQIEAIITPAQLQSIQTMGLTTADANEISQSAALVSQTSETSGPEQALAGGPAGAGDMLPAMDVVAAESGPDMPQGMAQSTSETPAHVNTSSQTDLAILQAVIDLLESKVRL